MRDYQEKVYIRIIDVKIVMKRFAKTFKDNVYRSFYTCFKEHIVRFVSSSIPKLFSFEM